MAKLHNMTTCLWFDKNAEEAVNFYTAVFNNSSRGRTAYYPNEGKEIHGMDEGTVLTIEFELEGNRFMALNGGPIFKFSEAISIMLYCDTQDEIDHYWEKLGEGGDPKAQQCGWLKDKFGLSWQITPPQLDDMMTDPDKEKVARVMKAFMPMKKIYLAAVEKAYAGE